MEMMLVVFLLCVTPFSADKVEIIKENGESIVHLLGNVIIEDAKTKITCAEAQLNQTQNYVTLINDVRIIDKNGEIVSDYAIYYFKQKKGYLNGNVSLLTGGEIISSDSLYYSGLEDLVKMFRNVKVEDKKNNLMAYAERGWYDLKKDEGYLMDKPKLEVARENKDPMTIRAREFQLMTNSSEFYGFDSVIAVIDSITVHCDTLLYNLETENGNMTRPVMLEKGNVLKGESGHFIMRNKNIESFSVQRGWSQYHTDEGSKNTVSGRKISILFDDGKASKIVVEGEPQGILRMKRTEEDAGD